MNDPVSVYRSRVDRFSRERDQYAQISRRVSLARIVAFLAALGLFVWAEAAGGSAGPLPVIGGTGMVLVFIGLVNYHGRLKRAEQWASEHVRLNEEAIKRHGREWSGLPGAEFGTADPGHPYAIDLDIFGRASLFQLLGTVSTASGRATLRDWLLAPAAPEEARARQAAVAELAPMIDLRDELTARGRLEGRSSLEEVEGFLRWAEDEPWLLHRRGLVWITRIVPLSTAALAIADITGFIERPFWMIPLLLGIAITFAFGGSVSRRFGQAFSRSGAFRQYAALFRLLAGADFEAPRLRSIQADLQAGGRPADRRMQRLERLMELADLRFSTFHFPIQALTLWDFYVLNALERWQTVAGKEARRWLRAVGEAEALAALAALAFDNPDWTFPDLVDEGDAVIHAEDLGHPLLAPATRVTNDVTVGPPGTFLLVTGSNMSGKSTLLRAIGTNVVLGQAGGPVCARAMRIPPVALITSMRVQDSLEEGISYFMAELKRLKQVVDAAKDVEATGRTLLYLLDEILHGTNSAERQIAAQRVIAHLVDTGAIGAVSTHDLALADAERLAAASRPVHFMESVSRENGRLSMSFDYKLREGVATSTNALKLMEIVGLEPGGSPLHPA